MGLFESGMLEDGGGTIMESVLEEEIGNCSWEKIGWRVKIVLARSSGLDVGGRTSRKRVFCRERWVVVVISV